MAFENCSFEPSGRLLESVSNYRSRWMVIRSQERQDPAYRATLLPISWAQVKTALTFLHFPCTSCYITCRRFECFYGESMGKYGQFDGQISTTNNIPKLFLLGQFPKLLERLFFKLGGRRLKLRSLFCTFHHNS